MLVCYGEGGEFAGDTWHQCFEHAREQADYQLGGRVGPWREIPLGADDPLGYALEVLRTATHEEMG
ncbi:MAG TPA: hypothetical protein VFQ45_02205 [Longimicrobium sp.]|nr:hypothetical protein [Longimicrobium sp.]